MGRPTKAVAIALALYLATPAFAQSALKPDLAGLGFLVGHWQSDDGKVADTGGTSKGVSVITVEANGGALLRRDHTDLFDKTGKSSGGFDQIMLIYSENGSLRADYNDGQHLIHYTSATVTPGKSVVFNGADAGPIFRLTYELKSPKILTVTFGMTAPGSTDFHAIATGTLKKTG